MTPLPVGLGMADGPRHGCQQLLRERIVIVLTRKQRSLTRNLLPLGQGRVLVDTKALNDGVLMCHLGLSFWASFRLRECEKLRSSVSIFALFTGKVLSFESNAEQQLLQQVSHFLPDLASYYIEEEAAAAAAARASAESAADHAALSESEIVLQLERG